jgi:transposase
LNCNRPGTGQCQHALSLGAGAGRHPSKVDGSKNEAASGGEFERVRRELAKVKTERNILKKALDYFAVDSKRSTVLPLGTAAYGLRAQCARLKLKIEPLCGGRTDRDKQWSFATNSLHTLYFWRMTMCFVNSRVNGLRCWSWDGERIIQDSIVPSSRPIVTTERQAGSV